MKKTFAILRTILIVILAIIVLWAVVHHILIRTESDNINQLGEYVTVDGKNMNIYATGEGAHTIVLMPGWGTTAPILDFEPLTNQLKESCRVVIVEPFGYGWSDNTDRERSVENIIEELRTALKESGENAPYVLMPHSISGIYAAWYANKYPEEVEAIVGIDCALPRQTEFFEDENPHVPGIAKIANPIGLQRLLCMIYPASLISDNSKGVYTDENLTEQKLLSNKVGFNTTVINEGNAIEENIRNTIDLKFDENLPILFFTRNIAGVDQGKTRKDFYETYITNHEIQSVTELDSGHYMHWKKSQEIADITMQFLENCNSGG